VGNGWRRFGFFYTYRKRVEWPLGTNIGPDYWCIRTRKLDFISYHLIRWIHGDEKLRQMGEKL
jgi:hypothetical protein